MRTIITPLIIKLFKLIAQLKTFLTILQKIIQNFKLNAKQTKLPTTQIRHSQQILFLTKFQSLNATLQVPINRKLANLHWNCVKIYSYFTIFNKNTKIFIMNNPQCTFLQGLIMIQLKKIAKMTKFALIWNFKQNLNVVKSIIRIKYIKIIIFLFELRYQICNNQKIQNENQIHHQIKKHQHFTNNHSNSNYKKTWELVMICLPFQKFNICTIVMISYHKQGLILKIRYQIYQKCQMLNLRIK